MFGSLESVLEVDWGVSLASIADGVLVDADTLMREIVVVVVVGVSVGEAAAACAVAMLSECGRAAQYANIVERMMMVKERIKRLSRIH